MHYALKGKGLETNVLEELHGGHEVPFEFIQRTFVCLIFPFVNKAINFNNGLAAVKSHFGFPRIGKNLQTATRSPNSKFRRKEYPWKLSKKLSLWIPSFDEGIVDQLTRVVTKPCTSLSHLRTT
ncbi:hypothetical protein NQ318_004142 [Aromia moschata]|uniref:Uncharacterized protein n=1 Tax=Aromia moschata TaxID=1265417 RepID=A0AAV8YLR2_9CUCU|nr:hypothetical protein NQ318_004142 [Aromia moschata]